MLHVPSFGALRIRRKGGNPYPDGRPVSAVLKRELGKWYAVVCFAVEIEEPADDGHVLGLDRNGGQVADSDGALHEMPDMKRLDAQAQRVQRRLSRRRKGSKRREKAKRHLAKVRRKIASRRKNWHHHVSRKLATKAGTVAVEGLNVKGMTRSAKGTAEEPGTMVPQKGRHQPRDPEHGLDGAQGDAGIQGGERDRRSRHEHVTDMPRVRRGRDREPQNSGRFRMPGLRPCCPCRSQCGEEHPRQGAGAPCRDERGVRDWRVCTARGVCAGNLY